MKKIVLTILLSAGLLWGAHAQYKNAIGIALGSPSGITYKTFISGNNALDFTLGYGWTGGDGEFFGISGLYEIHSPITNANGLSFYYGPGAHIGSWHEKDRSDNLFLGIDGAIGLEYMIPRVPIALSLDFRPGINLIGNHWDDHYHYFFWQSQFGIKYTF